MQDPSLPERKAFDSVLRNEACSEEDYARAQRVWQAFGHKKFVDYLSLYLAGIWSFFVFHLNTDPLATVFLLPTTNFTSVFLKSCQGLLYSIYTYS